MSTKELNTDLPGPLPKDFYHKPTIELAKSLLGCLLINQKDGDITGGYIVETEAYIGPMDQAAHSYNNRRTKRTEIMFAEPGVVYTYVMHTHCLVNVVSGGFGNPEAVLIRALEPVIGENFMFERRKVKLKKDIANGPGKLTKAMGIDMSAYGHTIYTPPLYIANGITPVNISQGKRIGIDNAGEAKDYPWRFWITNNPFVSRHQIAITND